MIFISHKLDEIFEICDRLTVFKDGEYVGDYDIGELNQLKLISLMVGKDTVELERNKQGYEFANAKVIAEMKDIRQGMRLNGINIEIKQGKWLALRASLARGGRNWRRCCLVPACLITEKFSGGEKRPVFILLPMR